MALITVALQYVLKSGSDFSTVQGKKEKQHSSKGARAAHYTLTTWREQKTEKKPRSSLRPQSEDYWAQLSAEAQNP